MARSTTILVLKILDDAAAGGMTASKFAALKDFVSELNATGGISVSAYVQQIAGDVIDGNFGNATWNGGASTAIKLGDLSDSLEPNTQADDLIDEWFLGANLPSLSLSALGQSNLNPTYQNSTLPLYGPTGTPTYEDINQGYLGDCYLVSSLGRNRAQGPRRDRGHDHEQRQRHVMASASWSTANRTMSRSIPNFRSWARATLGPTARPSNSPTGAADDWVALIEKAYAELNAQTGASHGMELNSASDS